MSHRHPIGVARWIHSRYRFAGPPANFAAVLGDYPIEVDFRDWPPDPSGVLVRGVSTSSIGVNRNHSQGRRHFTLWHELYHYLVHDEQLHFLCRPWEHRLQERECDVFAAHVLMPEEWVANTRRPAETARGEREQTTPPFV
ncbi:MAG: ImmA/IrrE family metallo-endopeptidase [Chloroflexota bacterium]|nr:ImmA/IrrE family metallo-endopeptidase [Chloroflexota bacterium]